MFKIEFIGNIGADATIRDHQGKKFVSFNLASTRKYKDNASGTTVERTDWCSCSINGDAPNLLPYLKKGQKVFVRGNGSCRTYLSQTGQQVAAVACQVNEIELCGTPIEKQINAAMQQAQQQQQMQAARPYAPQPSHQAPAQMQQIEFAPNPAQANSVGLNQVPLQFNDLPF